MLKQIAETYRMSGFLHHGYLLIGDGEAIQSDLVAVLETVDATANRVEENSETFGIDESRELAHRAARREWHGEREFVVLTARRYTVEAQNALLKLFEEPRAGLHFFLIGARVNDFLPTLRSRLRIIECRGDDKLGEAIENKKAREFLASTPIDRLAFIAAELKKELPREAWLPFLTALEIASHEIRPLDERALIEILSTRNYLTDPASSPRLLFEHLAFILPSKGLSSFPNSSNFISI